MYRPLIKRLLYLTLLPYILLSAFNHPAEDDFAYANIARDFGVIAAQSHWYQNWTGRYFATLLQSSSPIVWGLINGHKFTAALALFCFSLSVYFLLRVVSGRILATADTFFFFLGFLSLLIYRLPRIGDAFYWYTGFATYTACLIFVNIAVGTYLKHLIDKPPKDAPAKVRNRAIATVPVIVICSIIIIGSNEAIMAGWLTLLLVANFAFFYYHKKVDIVLLLPFLVSICCSLIVLFAPGNAHRLTAYPESQSLSRAITLTTLYSIWSLFKFVTVPQLAAAILAFERIKQLRPCIPEKLYSKNASAMAFLFYMAISVAIIFPATWGLGKQPPPRVENMLLYFNYIFVITIFCQTVWRANGLAYKLIDKAKTKLTTKQVALVLAVSLFILGNHSRAWIDLLFFAPKYDQEMNYRYSILLAKAGRDVVVPALSHRPKTFHTRRTDDIMPDVTDWRNRQYAKYFGVSTVRLERAQKD